MDVEAGLDGWMKRQGWVEEEKGRVWWVEEEVQWAEESGCKWAERKQGVGGRRERKGEVIKEK